MFGKPRFIPYLYAHVVAVSNLLWLGAAQLIARRSLPLWQGLMIGLISPILGALGLPLGVLAVLKLCYNCFPIGLATGYVVWRIMTSPCGGGQQPPNLPLGGLS